MRSLCLLPAALLGSPVAAFAQDRPREEADGKGGFAAGRHEGSVEVGEMRRRYLVHLPPGYDPAKAAPVVIVYHGDG